VIKASLRAGLAGILARQSLYIARCVARREPLASNGEVHHLASVIVKMRLLERIMRRSTQLTLSSIVSTDWQQLQAEVARISIIDVNRDNDIIR
jgi:hypothetical protein